MPDVIDELDLESFDHEDTDDGTEFEDTSITKPFNPVLIKIDTRLLSLDTLIRRISEGEVNLAPDFQRAEVWKPSSKSRLIESLLIRIPLPAFYMDATDDDRWLVVDGLQRLSTIRDFVVRKTMRLSDLEFLTQYNGCNYDGLPRNYQRRISETQVTVYKIESGTPDEVKFNIFKRINTGGLPLSSQEIRHALNQGKITTLLKDMADSVTFRKATWNSIKDKRMAARECVLRFLAFTINPPDRYKASDFDAFLSSAMATLNGMNDEELYSLRQRFVRSLDACFLIFGETAFRKPNASGRRAPINKALFEVWAVTMDGLSDNEIDRLKSSVQSAKKHVNDFMLSSSEFLSAISQSTGDPSKVRVRFSLFSKAIRECCND